jgi:hypothetical protein
VLKKLKVILLFVAFFLPILSRSQDTKQPSPTCIGQVPSSQATHAGSGSQKGTAQLSACPDQNDNSQAQQTKRMLWVVPNFAAVNSNTQLPPLSTREKFTLAAHDSILDYSSFTWAGILAAQSMALNSDPELGGGIAGYGRYYWRTFADGVSGTFFTEAIVPAITHDGSGRLFPEDWLCDFSRLRH